MKTEVYHLIGKRHAQRITPLVAALFDFELTHQAERLATRLRQLEGEHFSVRLSPEKRKKTRTALGFYFGGLVRAQVMDDKELHYDPDDIPSDWLNYRKLGKVNLDDFDNADVALRLEFFYEWKTTLKGDKIRIPKELKDKDNAELRKFIDDVMHWRDSQGYPFLDIESYKKKHKLTKLTSIKKKDVEDLHKGLEVPKDKPTF